MKTFLIWLNEQDAKQVDVFSGMYIPYLQQQEGWRSKLYLDSKGKPTIGHGALVDRSFDQTLQTVFPDQTPEWRRSIMTGGAELSREQGTALLSHQAKQKFDQARHMVGEERFDAMSPALQMHLASEHFRGMLGKSPKALQMIRAGDYEGARTEYLNAKDFRENQENSIGKRMQALSDALGDEGKPKQPPAPPPQEHPPMLTPDEQAAPKMSRKSAEGQVQ